MYKKISTNKKTNRTYLSIASGYRDAKTGKTKTVIIYQAHFTLTIVPVCVK